MPAVYAVKVANCQPAGHWADDCAALVGMTVSTVVAKINNMVSVWGDGCVRF